MGKKATKGPKGPVIKPLQSKPYTPEQKPPLVDSRKQKLDVGQIVVTAAYQTAAKRAPNVVAMSLLLEMQQQNTIHEQIGNTLFVAHQSKDPTKYVFRALNADVAAMYAQNAEAFITHMLERGATVLATQFADEKLLTLIKILSTKMARKMARSGAPSMSLQTFKRDGEYLVILTRRGG